MPFDIVLRKLSVAYPGKQTFGQIIKQLSLQFASGKIHIIMGSNGCGKSTLLKAIVGAVVLQNGEIATSDHAAMTDLSMEYIPQDYRQGLFPWKRVRDNLRPWWADGGHTKLNLENHQLIEALRLSNLLQRFPYQLSGGQQQRIMLGRSILTDVDLVVLDEPFSAMDALTRSWLLPDLRKLWLQHRVTVIIALHEPGDAAELADSVWTFSGPPLSLEACFEREEAPESSNRDDAFKFKILAKLKHINQTFSHE